MDEVGSETESLLNNAQRDYDERPFHPKTVQRIITRIQALVMELIPIEVDCDELRSPVSSILTPPVIRTFVLLAGDFTPCLPFCLLMARQYFRLEAHRNPSDADENECRKVACEVLARKVVMGLEMSEQYRVLGRRWTRIESDGDESLPLSALEAAIDQHATFFLSSSESQRCVFALWRGLLVQSENDHGRVEYMPYKNAKKIGGVVSRFDPSRVGVPRYQFFFRIALWVIFIIAYSVAIQTPERGFGFEDVILYVQLLGYLTEDLVKIYKIGSLSAFGFWTCVNLCIYVLLTIAFVYRCIDISISDPERSLAMRMLSFQFLASASPLIWMKMLTIFDLFQFFGTLQIVLWRMLKESALFFTLLGLLAIGFGQALTGLDNPVEPDTDSSTEEIIHSLIQGLLGSPVFDIYDRESSSYPFGMILYYFWSTLTLVLLLNILVALFGSAYQECVDDAVPTFMAFFAGKTISAIRAPDTYVYPAPFNLVEICILPLEFVMKKDRYATLNRYLMGTLFFIPLCGIALFETHFDADRARDFTSLTEEQEDYTPDDMDPEPFTADDEMGPGDEGLVISKVSFDELKKTLPNLTKSIQSEILWEVKELRKELEEMRKERGEKKEKEGENGKKKK